MNEGKLVKSYKLCYFCSEKCGRIGPLLESVHITLFLVQMGRFHCCLPVLSAGFGGKVE